MKKILFSLTVVFSLILASCQVDEPDNSNHNYHGNGFSLSYEVSSSFATLTKSTVALENGEDNIRSLYVLFFENTTGGTGEFIEAINATPTDGSVLSTTGVLDIRFPQGSKLNNSTDYKILLCANIEKYSDIEDFSSWESLYGLTENEVQRTFLRISGVDPGLSPEIEQEINDFFMPMNTLPMSASTVKKAGEGSVTVELTRAVSRFDVVSAANGYELVSASIWNGYTSTSIWETSFNNFTDNRTERYYGVKTDKNEITGSLYAFENFVSSPAQNDKLTTCLIIGLRRENRTQTEYFRANINVGSRGQQLNRNNVYRTTIVNVRSTGAVTERDAYENSDNLIDYITVNTNYLSFSPGGNFSDNIMVTSSGDWKAEIFFENGIAFFEEATDDDDGDQNDKDSDNDEEEEAGPTVWQGSNGDEFIIRTFTLPDLTVEAQGKAVFELKDNEDIKVEIELYQRAVSPQDVVIQTSHYKSGTLYHTAKVRTREFVHNLAANMRNKELFSSESSLNTTFSEFVFIYDTKTRTPHDQANVYQFTKYNSKLDDLKAVKTWMDQGANRFLFVTDRSSSNDKLIQYYENAFFGRTTSSARKYSVSDSGIDQKKDRFFYPNADLSNKLIEYLLKTGPFTQGGTPIDPSNILLKSRNTVGRGLSSWDDTFIPLIMVTKSNKDYCIFGIDPTNRFIYLGEPGIFGSNKSAHANYNNYTTPGSDNERFMNNFIAWLNEAVSKGEPFINQFR